MERAPWRIMASALIDEVTGTEVIVITPLNATRLQMQRVAMAKLRRKLDTAEAETPAPKSPNSGRYA